MLNAFRIIKEPKLRLRMGSTGLYF